MGAGVSKRTKVALVGAAAAAAVVVAIKMTQEAVFPPSKVYVPPSWQTLTPQEREKRLDQEERKRRLTGRGPARQLPEDRPPSLDPPATAPR